MFVGVCPPCACRRVHWWEIWRCICCNMLWLKEDLGHWQWSVAFETLFGYLPSVAGLKKKVSLTFGEGERCCTWLTSFAGPPLQPVRRHRFCGCEWVHESLWECFPPLGVQLEVQVGNSRAQSWVVHIHPPLHPFAFMSCLISGLPPVLMLLFNSMVKGMRTRKEQAACEAMEESFSHEFFSFFPTVYGLFLSFTCLLMVMAIGI